MALRTCALRGDLCPPPQARLSSSLRPSPDQPQLQLLLLQHLTALPNPHPRSLQHNHSSNNNNHMYSSHTTQCNNLNSTNLISRPHRSNNRSRCQCRITRGRTVPRAWSPSPNLLPALTRYLPAHSRFGSNPCQWRARSPLPPESPPRTPPPSTPPPAIPASPDFSWQCLPTPLRAGSRAPRAGLRSSRAPNSEPGQPTHMKHRLLQLWRLLAT
mmetsp:Transcript_28818/g.61327  ORF Transcript_28818/g.61327 Transcript_28818/m.61327 type:complete len:214 (+) Transcript_28818:1405-2046(+)